MINKNDVCLQIIFEAKKLASKCIPLMKGVRAIFLPYSLLLRLLWTISPSMDFRLVDIVPHIESPKYNYP